MTLCTKTLPTITVATSVQLHLRGSGAFVKTSNCTKKPERRLGPHKGQNESSHFSDVIPSKPLQVTFKGPVGLPLFAKVNLTGPKQWDVLAQKLCGLFFHIICMFHSLVVLTVQASPLNCGFAKYFILSKDKKTLLKYRFICLVKETNNL